jgi:hypothetical protein
MPRPHPYRMPQRPKPVLVHRPVDPLAAARLASKAFLLVWALLRLVACATRGLDVEGCIALVVVVAVVRSLIQGKARS